MADRNSDVQLEQACSVSDCKDALNRIADSLEKLVEQGKPKWITLTYNNKTTRLSIASTDSLDYGDRHDGENGSWLSRVGENDFTYCEESAAEITAIIAALGSEKDEDGEDKN